MGLFDELKDRFADLIARAPILNIAADEGHGSTVVLLHGIASSASTFELVIPQLRAHHRVIAIELLGFGGSPAPEDATYTMDEHVAAIAATIHSLHLRDPFILVGHSLGSLIAARYAARHPHEVQRLVLASPPIYLRPEEIGDPIVRTHVSAYLAAYDFLRANKDFTISTATRIARLFQLGDSLSITEKNWTAFTLSLQQCIESQTTISDIAAAKCQVDVVVGSLDQFVAPGTLDIIGRMRHVTTHLVHANDHVVRRRLARVIVKTIDPDPTDTAPATVVR
jgi:pimeloyl-ACP methyl ester carboxylesterase